MNFFPVIFYAIKRKQVKRKNAATKYEQAHTLYVLALRLQGYVVTNGYT